MSEETQPSLPQILERYWRPMVFGLAGLLILLGALWLDATLSTSRFSEVFVSDADSSPALSPTGEVELTAEQQLELAREQALQLIEEQRQPMAAAADPTAAIRADIEAMLTQWISSWVAKDAGTYLSFYAENFDTPFNISREEWAGFRIRRIEEPRWIRVQLEQLDFVQLEADFAALSVTQLYATPGYADRTRKHIDLVRTERGWKILREDSVETVRIE